MSRDQAARGTRSAKAILSTSIKWFGIMFPTSGTCSVRFGVPEARKKLAGGETTGSTRFPTVEEGSALEGREKQAEDGDVESPHASRAPAGARRERTMGVPHEPVVAPPANVSRPSRTPFIGDPRRGCGCLDGNDWKLECIYAFRRA